MTRFGLISTILLASASISRTVSAQPADDRWYWFYAGLTGSEYDYAPSAKVDSRYGRATVRISGSTITIDFDEPAVPEARPKFKGRIARNGTIEGVLPDFFDGDAPGPGRVVGRYRRGSAPTCSVEDIHLYEAFPSATAWVLFHSRGDCMDKAHAPD